VADNDREQALWLFSPSACGAYGFENLKIAHAGRPNPVGQIILESDKNVRLLAGSGLLLRVTTPLWSRNSKGLKRQACSRLGPSCI
jgi:hypothetical protein